MDFIPLTLPDGTWTLVLQYVALVLMLFALPLISRRVSESKWAVACYIALGLAISAALTSFIGIGIHKDAVRSSVAGWESAVVAEVEDAYGIELSHDEFKTLNFPTTEPEEDFVAYGTIADTVVKGGMVKQRATTLIWSDGELSLGSLKGELTTVGGR